jgi:tetratricopeptide (TPR) repeat protein
MTSSGPSHDVALRWMGVILYVLVLVLYWPTLDYRPISLDDQSQLREVTTDAAPLLLRSDHFGHFRPLKKLIFWSVARDTSSIVSWRALFLGVFMASMVMLQLFVTRLSASRRMGLAVAACWALNPTTASVVSWLSAANIEVCLLAMLIYVYCGDRALTAQGGSREALAHLSVALTGLAIALSSHELALVTPVLLYSTRRLFQSDANIKRPIYVASAALIALWLLARAGSQAVAIAYRFQTEAGNLSTIGAARYLLANALLWIWPVGRFGVLLVDQPRRHLVASAVCWLVLLVACALTWRFRRKDALLTFGICWAAVLLVPVANFIPLANTPVALHYLYLPGAGLALALVRATVLLSRFVGRYGLVARSAVIAIFAGALCVLWLPEAKSAVAAWGDEEELFRKTHENYGDNVEVLVNLSSIYLGEHRYDAAASVLSQARQLSPTELNVVRNSYALLWETNQVEAALRYLDEHPSLSARPEFLIRRAEALERMGDYEGARVVLQRAFESADPTRESDERYTAGYRLVADLLRTHRGREAEALIDRLVVEYPDKPELAAGRDRLRQSE